MKKICCICSIEATSQVQEMLNLIRRYTKVNTILITPSESIVDFDVVIFVLSKDALSDEFVLNNIKFASDLNKTFVPVIIGGNFFTNWLLKKRYQGPDLRTPFLSLKKDDDMFAFIQQLASFGGSKILGDAYGIDVEFNVDLDCKVLRNDVFIAESNPSKLVKITLYKGNHRLIFQSKKYPDLSTEVKIKVKNLSTRISKDVKIAKHRIVKKMAFANGYYEGALYLDDRDGDGTFWFPNGDVYNGHWTKNSMTGIGTMRYASGEIYVGNWESGRRQGHGKLTWHNNEYYEGDFLNDKISGKGKKCYNDGSSYNGSWNNGEYNGKGTKRFADGSKYVGDWLNGIQHGHGIEYDSNGNKIFEGEWKNGQKQTFFNKIKNWWNSL